MKLPDILNGVRYWALWHHDPFLKVKFKVFKYAAFDAKSGLYYFETIRGARALLTRNHSQINTAAFRPFLIDNPNPIPSTQYVDRALYLVEDKCQFTNTDVINAENTLNESEKLKTETL